MAMLRYFSAMAVVAIFGLTGSSAAQPALRGIRAFDIPTLEALGLDIYRQDTAAWVGTDALQAIVPDLAGAHLKGWIVVPHGADERVRFLRDVGHGLEAGYDVDVDFRRHTKISEPSDRHLTGDEIAAFAARETAAHNMPGACRSGYNTVVAKDPQGDGWLVWLLAPMPAMGDIPIGGHYRFTISRDGKTVIQRDALSASCMVMHPPDAKQSGGKPAVAFVTNVVAPTPLETHVFLQLQAHIPMVVLAGDHQWTIEEGQVRDMGPIKRP